MAGPNKEKIPVVAIVGRPNVGKSLLFNRLAGKAVSLVDAEAGVTRDRVYAEVEWDGKNFSLVDTGGLYPGEKGGILARIERQVELAIEEAAVVVWVLDQQDGVTGLDEDIAGRLRPATKPVILAVNKADNITRMEDIGDFYRLGFGDPIPISSLHGLNTNTLLDKIVSFIPRASIKARPETIRVAIVGRPNVGKSSFINSLLKEERVIVDSLPGTTRGVVPIPFSLGEEHFTLLDTSGLRKRARLEEELEKKMSVWTNRAIRNSHVSILLIDAQDGVTRQDVKISDYIWNKGKGMVIALNKWDLIKGDEKVRASYLESVGQRIPMAKFIPILFTSALFGQNVAKAVSLAHTVFSRSRLRIETHILNQVIEEAVKARQAPYKKGGGLKILYATQVKVEPPTFVFFVNDPARAGENYVRYLARVIYTHFDFGGTPIRIFFKPRRV